MSMSTANRDLVVSQVRELARTRDHKIAARQLAQLETITDRSLLALRTYLDGRPLRADAPQVPVITAQIEHATQMAMAAAQAARPDADARFIPAGPSGFRGDEPGTARPADPGRRPGTRITQEGIYYYEGQVYKVILSQYSSHWQARRLNPKAEPGEQRWTYIQGMMAVLRAEHRMTAEQSREYEELYGYPTCTDCGAPLENDLSRLRRVGPKCWVKNGHTDDEIPGDGNA